MVWLKKIRDFFLWPYYRIRDEIEFKKKLKKLREQDPFIYK